jgi:hypothetical protein
MTYILKFNLPEQSYTYVTVPPPTIDTDEVEPGDSVPIGTTIENDGEVPADIVVDLVVDDEVVDTVTIRVDGNSSEDIELTWPDVTEGEHDIKLVVTMPNGTTGDDPVDIIPVTTPEGGPIVVSVPKVTVGRPVRIDTSELEEGNTVIVPARVSNPGSTPREARVDLVVDGEVVDSDLVTVPGGSDETVDLEWPDVTGGEHDIVIRVYMPGEYGTTTPVDTVTVTDETGGPVQIPEGDDQWIEGPLKFLNPLYDYQPFSSVPDDWKPWFLPLLLIGIILGVGLIALGRRRKKKDEAKVPDTELKAVKMPPVTGDGAPAPTKGPEVPVSLTAADPGDAEGTVVKPPDKPPASTPPPVVVPPIASVTDDGKGPPCVEIIDDFKTTARGVSDADAKAEDAKDEADDAQEEADKADLTADDAEEKAREAQKECDDAKRQYEGEGVEDAEKEAKKAEGKVKDMGDRLEELRGDIPDIDGVSTEPRPGYTHGGVGFGDMVSVTHVYYRDDKAEIDLNRELKKRYKEYKKVKKDLDDAKEAADEARKKADDLAEQAKDAKRRMDEACEKARKAKEEAERLRKAANDAQENATTLAGAATEARETAQEADQAAAPGRKKANDCKDCLAKVKRAKARIEQLKKKYERLKGGSQIDGPWNRYENMDPHGAWDQWWHSFKGFRDNAKRLMDMKGFADAELPEEYEGLWDWGGAFSVAVGYGVEDYGKCPIPTDTIKAVGGIYGVFQAMFNPKYQMGAKILNLHLSSTEADAAAEAFRTFPRLMERALQSFEKLSRLVDLDGEILEALQDWKACLDKLPAAPETPEVDLDKLCYKQCLDKLKELEEAEKKLRELIRRAEACKPSGLDGKYGEANKIKGQLNGMKRAMDRCRDGLENYRRAHRAHLDIDD